VKSKLDSVGEVACRLRSERCVKDPIRYSHIVPEFLYRPYYDGKGRLIAIDNTEPSPAQYIQKGFSYPLMCDGCEAFLNDEYEKPFKRLWTDKSLLPSIAFRRAYKVKVAEPQLIRLFLLSVLWRAAVCPVPPFAQVNIQAHEDRLAEMIRERNAGSFSDYPIFAVLPLLPDSKRVGPVLPTPYKMDCNEVPTIVIAFGGCLWHFMMTYGTEQIPFHQLVLTDKGAMRVLALDSWKIKAIRDSYTKHFQNAEREGWVEPWNK
jgi:hypothetical protein